MKIYILFAPAIFALHGCSTFLEEDHNEDKVVVAQLCTTMLPDNKVKQITLLPIHLVKASKDATEKMNSISLPSASLDMNFVGVTPNHKGVYSSVVGHARSLRYTSIFDGEEKMSFKRDFTQYNEEWSKWETTDESDVEGMSQTNKVRFKTVVSNGNLYNTRFSNILPDSCD
jgi:hypothetical protein